MFRNRNLRTIRTILILVLTLGIVISLAYAKTKGYYAEKEIGKKGGELKLKDKKAKDKTTVTFPKGALSEKHLITMQITTDEKSNVYFEFGPHGTYFNEPVELELSWESLRHVKGKDLILYYYDENVEDWVEETNGKWNNKDKKVTLYINHFSLYHNRRR